MAKMRMLKKIIYFDETSAIDLLQIMKKGKFTRTLETAKTLSGNLGADADAKADLGNGGISFLAEKLSGLSVGAGGSMNGVGKIQGSRISKTLLENSLLYDFLTEVEIRKRNFILDIDEGFKLSVPKGSMTYYAIIAPLTEMMDGNQAIDDTDISVAVSKMNSGIRNSKGYYELIGERDSETRVFRFNINSFRNNYRIQDLRKMELCLYSLRVGETQLSELNFETEFDIEDDDTDIEFKGFTEGKGKNKVEDKVVPVYDVLLAGIK